EKFPRGHCTPSSVDEGSDVIRANSPGIPALVAIQIDHSLTVGGCRFDEKVPLFSAIVKQGARCGLGDIAYRDPIITIVLGAVWLPFRRRRYDDPRPPEKKPPQC